MAVYNCSIELCDDSLSHGSVNLAVEVIDACLSCVEKAALEVHQIALLDLCIRRDVLDGIESLVLLALVEV